MALPSGALSFPILNNTSFEAVFRFFRDVSAFKDRIDTRAIALPPLSSLVAPEVRLWLQVRTGRPLPGEETAFFKCLFEATRPSEFLDRMMLLGKSAGPILVPADGTASLVVPRYCENFLGLASALSLPSKVATQILRNSFRGRFGELLMAMGKLEDLEEKADAVGNDGESDDSGAGLPQLFDDEESARSSPG